MKKTIILLFLISCLTLSSCGNEAADSTSSDPQGTNQKTEDLSVQNTGYTFQTNGVTVVIDAKAAPIIEALGEPASYFEAESCAYQGMDKLYTYGSYEINTYEKDGTDYISSVRLMDDTVQTQEGVSLFMTMEDMTSAYGSDYAEEQGMYVYEKDGMKLKFIITDNEIVSIEYDSAFLD